MLGDVSLFSKSALQWKTTKIWVCNILFILLVFPTLDASLQHIPIVEIHDLHESPASEVLPAVEEQLEQDVLQPQDVHASVSSSIADKVEELDKGKITVII